MRIPTFSLLALILASSCISGCAVYGPPPRAYVVVPAPVLVVPGWGWGYHEHHRW